MASVVKTKFLLCHFLTTKSRPFFLAHCVMRNSFLTLNRLNVVFYCSGRRQSTLPSSVPSAVFLISPGPRLPPFFSPFLERSTPRLFRSPGLSRSSRLSHVLVPLRVMQTRFSDAVLPFRPRPTPLLMSWPDGYAWAWSSRPHGSCSQSPALSPRGTPSAPLLLPQTSRQLQVCSTFFVRRVPRFFYSPSDVVRFDYISCDITEIPRFLEHLRCEQSSVRRSDDFKTFIYSPFFVFFTIVKEFYRISSHAFLPMSGQSFLRVITLP